MNADVVPYLRCPVCADPLAAADGGPHPRVLRCDRGHSFDVARHGYVHLAPGRATHPGDPPEMVAARDRFLGAGHYDFLSAALASAAAEATAATAGGVTADGPALVVDVGAGTGRHLAAVLDALPGAVGLALDSSRAALRRAARAHPRAAAALADTWRRLPVADAAAAVLLNVFAPRNPAEFRRVLHPDGLLLVATPEADHLAELVATLALLRVDPEKPARVAAGLADGFAEAGRTVHRRPLRLTHDDVLALVAMGPSAWHTEPATLAERVRRLPAVTPVTAATVITRYRPRHGRP
jgi:23S rRNA (guanine745-N1)-methyltransferase